ncbi:Ig-like domain repeat protein [Terriglobus tenax]|uniref:Ig-like domain repeat protein n=1 Tax=Terriglobus tenax TaxID=1111115 RepID=UPI0021E07D24|nr:Ig-like domain repeat protein [Terriglobus tenax]
MLNFRCFAASFLALVSISASAQIPNRAKPLITQPVNDARRVALRGTIHPLVHSASDQGSVGDAVSLDRMLMTLRRSEDQETELKQLIDQQQDKTSANYHRWLTPDEFGARFGASDSDISTLTSWLTSHGFSNVSVSKGRTTVEFSGSAGTARQAFGLSMHRFSYLGKQRTANVTDPLIPAALAPLVAGFSSLNNFPRHTFSQNYGAYRRDAKTGKLQPTGNGPSSQYVFTSGGSRYLGLTPYDFATLYNLKPLWNTSVDGTGQTIAIVGQSDLDPQDFVNFRTLFGLPLGNTSGPTGTQYLNILHNGPNPGFLDDEIEGDIDVQWSGAAAPGATIDYVSSLGTETTAGIDLSALYIIDNNLAPIISESWGICEFFAGTDGNSFYSSLWQQAAAQGITIMVAAGDAGSGTCDQNKSYASYGLTVNAIASTPYSTAVGGTDFQTFFDDNGQFGSGNNTTTKQSISAYIPETTWNNTCTNEQLGLSSLFPGSSAETICNNSLAQTRYGLLTTTGGGGGRSNCISLTGNTLSTCTGGYAKPSWQTGSGVPSDNVRDLPDVSLFASNGFSGAFYIICQADAISSGAGCNIAAPYSDLLGVGGTSVGSPAMAGIMALVAQKNGGGRLGNANYNLYALFNRQVTAGTGCNSSLTPNAACNFNDVTTGTNSVPCVKGSANCSLTNSADTYGILSGFSSTSGFDLTTGLGTVNAANLANNWSTVTYAATATTLSLSPTTITHGTPVAATVTVTSGSGTPTGDVSINGNTTNGSVGQGTLTAGNYSHNFNNFPGGTYLVTAHYGGDQTRGASDSNAVSLTVTPENSKTALQPLFYNVTTGAVSTASSMSYGQYLALIKFTVAAASCSGITPCNGTPTGTIAVQNNGAAYGTGNYKLNSEGVAEIQTIDLTPGSYSFAGAYSGDASFNASTSNSGGFTVSKSPTNTSFTAGASTLSAGQTAVLNITVPSSSYGNILQTGTVSILNGSTVLGTVAVTGTYSTATGLNYATATYTLNASQLTTGPNSITVQYSGDNNYLGSTSGATTIYLPAVSTTTLSLSPSSIAIGTTNVTATYGVTSTTPGTIAGTVNFTVDGVNAGSTTTLSGTYALPTSSLSAAAHTVYAVFTSSNSSYQNSVSAPATLTVTPAPTFTLGASPASLTVTRGVPGTANISVTAVNGFSSSVALACSISGSPTGAVCGLSPSTVTPGVVSVLNITTVRGSSRTGSFAHWKPAAFGGVAFAGLLFLLRPRRRRMMPLLGLLLLLGAAGAMNGCGGGGTASTGTPGTPVGTYTVTITGTSGAITQTATLSLTVN